MPWYFYYAFKQLFPSNKYISYFSLISIIGVTLGVSLLIIVQSVMNGFGENIRMHLSKTYGDLTVTSEKNFIDDYFKLGEQLIEYEGLISVEPYLETVVMVQSKHHSAFPIIRGVETIQNKIYKLRNYKYEGHNSSSSIEQFIISGSFESLNDETVFIGELLANALEVSIGDSIIVYSQNTIERIADEEWLFPREFTIAGLIQTGSPELDNNILISSLTGLQELLDNGSVVSGFNISAKESSASYLLQIKNQLECSFLDDDKKLIFETWMDKNFDLLFIIDQEKRVISFIIIFIILVASFSIAVALMLTVIRKTKEIGLLRSLGAESWQIALSFCLQGLLIGVFGSILGILFAFLVLENREIIFSFYTSIIGQKVNFLGAYDLYSIPVHYLIEDFIKVIFLSIFISFCASFFPAIRASKLKPSEALRND